MLEAKKKMYDKSGPRVAAALRKRNLEGYYCSTAAEAVEKVLELIPAGDVVSWGGAATVDELGIKDRLRHRGQPVIDRDTAHTEEERMAMLHQTLTCDTFLMSSNAISEDGQMVNIDGTGNRVAALCVGPKQIIVVAGMNKVTADLDSAISRARHIAAPANAQRFDIRTPCSVNGQCADCTSPDCCICAHMVITRFCKTPGRIKVVLVGEELGL